MNYPRLRYLAAIGLLSAAPVVWAESASLKDIMQQLENSWLELNSALLREDLTAAAVAAIAIADHPKPDASERLRVLTLVGDRAAEFRSWDNVVHNAASELAHAAGENDSTTAQSAYHKVLDGCLGCHRAFRPKFRGNR